MYKEISKEDLAYYAGFFDGEGCIMINKRPNSGHRLDVRISNTNKHILLGYISLFGGGLYKQKRRKDTHKDKWQWCLSTKASVLFLKTLYPYLRLKKAEALLAIEYQQRIKGSNKPLTVSEKSIRDDYYLRMRDLKRVI